MRKIRQRLSLILVAAALIPLLQVPTRAEGTSFSDIPSNAWYMDAVEYVTEHGIMTGIAEDQFAPKQGMTRAMLVQVLYAAAGKPETKANEFVDVKKGVWYEEASAWAEEQGIVTGYEGKLFKGNEAISRQQFVTILWRYAGSPEAKTGKYFADRKLASDYAWEAMNWARSTNIVSGAVGNLFQPRATVIRSHCAAILKNYMLMGPNTLEKGNETVSAAKIHSTEQQTFYLWNEGNMPSTIEYNRNTGNFMDDLSFRPNIITYPVDEDTKVKGAVVILAGGSFEQRSNSKEGYSVAYELSRDGYVSFVVNYRLYPYSVKDAEMDVQRAIRFVKNAAEDYGYDEKQVAALGFSAGAMAIGNMLLDFNNMDNGTKLDSSYQSDELDRISSEIAGTGMLYGFYGNLKESIKDVKEYQGMNLPDAFFCYGTEDDYADDCRGCAKALLEAEVDVKILELKGMGHGFGLDGDWLDSFERWLDKQFDIGELVTDLEDVEEEEPEEDQTKKDSEKELVSE